MPEWVDKYAKLGTGVMAKGEEAAAKAMDGAKKGMGIASGMMSKGMASLSKK